MEEKFEKLLNEEKERNIFISYKWNEISEKEMKIISNKLMLIQINAIVDKYNLKYGDSITEYMTNLIHYDGVILIICDDYFFSMNCMYEGVMAMKEMKNKTIIRMVENSIYEPRQKEKIKKYWNNYDETGIIGSEKNKLKMVRENYQEFIAWITDTNTVRPNDITQFEKELDIYVSKVYFESDIYRNMVSDLIVSKSVVISKVCDTICEEYYRFKNISYSTQESPINDFKCLFDFKLILEKINTNEIVKMPIKNVVGIESGNLGEKFAKYYFVIPRQDSLETLAYEEKFKKDKSKIEYNRRRIMINF